jgi:hypothetical protein
MYLWLSWSILALDEKVLFSLPKFLANGTLKEFTIVYSSEEESCQLT